MSDVPYSLDAERGVLGACLVDGMRLVPVCRRLFGQSASAFYSPEHREVWKAILDVDDAGRPVDLLTVTQRLRATERLEHAGGEMGVEALIDASPVAAHGEWYADTVRQKWIARREVELCTVTMREAMTVEDAEGHVRRVQQAFAELCGDVRPAELSNREIMAQSEEAWRKAKAGDTSAAMGLPLPWDEFNAVLCGLEVGLTVVAGRPSAGKTTFEDETCCALASAGLGVARVTLDSTRKELLERAMARKGGVSLPKLKRGFARENQLLAVHEAADVLGEYPMWINDVDTDIRVIAGWIRQMKVLHDIQLFTVDYIQLINASNMGRSEWDSNARVAYVSGVLKKLSLELGIPGMVLSQLSRGSDKDTRSPKLSDLRDSGAIEQDASKVIFLYQDADKHKQMEERAPGATKHKRPVWFDLQKNKNGETGKNAFWMLPSYFRFEEAEIDAKGNEFCDDTAPPDDEKAIDAAIPDLLMGLDGDLDQMGGGR
jgi:replicative DNA helicase